MVIRVAAISPSRDSEAGIQGKKAAQHDQSDSFQDAQRLVGLVQEDTGFTGTGIVNLAASIETFTFTASL
jgi:hypothetical protein